MAKEPRTLRIIAHIKAIQNELLHHKTVRGFTYDELADGIGISRVALMSFMGASQEDCGMRVSTLVNIEAYLVAMKDPDVRKARRATHPLKAVLTAWREGKNLPIDNDDKPCDEEEEL